MCRLFEALGIGFPLSYPKVNRGMKFSATGSIQRVATHYWHHRILSFFWSECTGHNRGLVAWMCGVLTMVPAHGTQAVRLGRRRYARIATRQ